MAGFMAGFGQAFGQLPDIIQKDEVLQQNRIAAKKAEMIAAKKATGDLISQYADAIEGLPEDQVGLRTNILFQQIESATGQKVNPAIAKIINADPKNAAKVMSQLYGDQGGFTMEALGKVLGDPTIFAGVYDAHNRRNRAIESAASFKQGVSAPTPEAALQSMANIDPNSPGFKERLAGLQAVGESRRKGQEFSSTNPLEMAARRHGIDLANASPAARRFLQQELIGQAGALKGAEKAGEIGATPIPLDAAQLTQQPFGTTYGDLGGAGAQPSPVTPTPGTSPLGIRNNNPGNLRPPGASTGFQKFDTMEAGMAALDRNLQSYAAKGRDTIRSVISAWAPPSENDTEAYISTVAKRLGVPADAKLDMANPLVRQALGTAITLHENGPKSLLAQEQSTAPAQRARGLVPPTAAKQAEAKVIAEGGAKTFNEMRTSYVKAQKDEGQFKTIGALLDKVDTGSLAPVSLSFQKALQGVGFDISDKASYAEAARGLAIHLIGAARTEAGGVGATSNYEDALYQQAIPNIDKLPGANKILIGAAVKNAQRTQEIYKEVAKYVKQNGYDEVAVTDIIDKYKEDHPIFSAEDAKYLMGGKSSVLQKDTRPPLNSFFK